VDEKAGIKRIPIERAMTLLVESAKARAAAGLTVRPKTKEGGR
jgi:hypothetical protein